jgi:hypothetical protein
MIALLAFSAVGARADIVVVGGDAGTIYDGILDGFPFPPPGVAQDGTPDFVGNALGIALQTGVTEERGVAEFPLDDLAGLTSADIVSATLSFNIDDVVTTFGPGTSFDGTAAETIVLFSYNGNGVIELADFNNVAGAPLFVVDTTSLGVINDTSLATSGPLLFDIDVTAALGALLDASATDIGIVWTTNDNLSATSLDNLGDGGAGPPGVDGATMPFITIVTVSAEPPVFNNDQLKCQKAIGKESGKFVKTKQKALTGCLDKVLKAVSKGQDLTNVTAKCVGDLNESDAESKLGKAIAKLESKVTALCSGLTPADIHSPCSAGATTFGEVASCLVDNHETKVEEMVAAEYANACELISAVGLDTSFPALCTTAP